MHIAILGAGAVGQVIVRELLKNPGIVLITLGDKEKKRAERVAHCVEKGRVHTALVNPHDRTSVKKFLHGSEIVINSASPSLNESLMEVALEEGLNYIDLGACGPRKLTGHAGVMEQLEKSDLWEKSDLTALLGMGLDPGISNLMARWGHDHLDVVSEIKIRSGGTASWVDGIWRPLFSPEAFLEDIFLPAIVFSGGEWLEKEPLSDEEVFEFPPPVGAQTAFLHAHEEPRTLPRYLEKTPGFVDFKYSIPSQVAEALRLLKKWGFFERREVEVAGSRVSPWKLLLSLFPSPIDAPPPKGYKCLVVDVTGRLSGQKKCLRSYVYMSHEEARQRGAINAVSYLTGISATVGATLLDRGVIRRSGVFPPEAFEASPFLMQLETLGVAIERTEVPPRTKGE